MEEESYYEFVPVLAAGKKWVAMRFDDLQQSYIEISAADAMLMATSIREMVAELFGPLVEAVPDTENEIITVAADRSTVKIELHAETLGMRGIVMQPRSWLWFANKLEDSSSLSALPGNC